VTTGYGAVHNTMKVIILPAIIIIISSSSLTIIISSPLRRRPRRDCSQVEPGSTAAVFGLGGVGLSVVMGLKVNPKPLTYKPLLNFRTPHYIGA
jgi:hypothetical protein